MLKCLLPLLAGLCALPVHGQQEEPEALRTTVEQWVAAMQKIQDEQARWTREKQVLQSNKEGLQQEIVELEEAIAAAKGRLEQVDAREQEKLKKKRENDEARSALATALTTAEGEARRVIPLLPDFYIKENTKLGAAVEDLKKTEYFNKEDQGRDLGKRLGAIVMVLSEAEKFQQRNWVRDEEREIDGEPMLVTTIYLGLSVAFSADQQRKVALRGSAGPGGWTFDKLKEPDAPARILELIEVASLKGEIKFVEVPLELR